MLSACTRTVKNKCIIAMAQRQCRTQTSSPGAACSRFCAHRRAPHALLDLACSASRATRDAFCRSSSHRRSSPLRKPAVAGVSAKPTCLRTELGSLHALFYRTLPSKSMGQRKDWLKPHRQGDAIEQRQRTLQQE